jgi:hypothetical protein
MECPAALSPAVAGCDWLWLAVGGFDWQVKETNVLCLQTEGVNFGRLWELGDDVEVSACDPLLL